MFGNPVIEVLTPSQGFEKSSIKFNLDDEISKFEEEANKALSKAKRNNPSYVSNDTPNKDFFFEQSLLREPRTAPIL